MEVDCNGVANNFYSTWLRVITLKCKYKNLFEMKNSSTVEEKLF